jgi:pyrroloquinoline quinone biosynthesis protein B
MFFGHEAMGTSAIPVFAMPRFKSFLETNGPWSQLVELNNIELMPLENQREQRLGTITVIPFTVPHRDEYSETVGYRILGPNKSAIFIPDINKWSIWDTDITELIKEVDYALLDATFYKDGELGNRDMSQIPHPFVTESMALFGNFTPEQRNKVWFIHFNHTNPLLNEESEQAQFVRSEGFNVAREGIRLPL